MEVLRIFDKSGTVRFVIFVFWLFIMLFLSECSVWKDDFDAKPIRGLPRASIHEISTMLDNGTIKECEVQGNIKVVNRSSKSPDSSVHLFSDGKVSRGSEKVHRIYITAYEDENKNLHAAHNLYVVIEPASWTFHKIDEETNK